MNLASVRDDRANEIRLRAAAAVADALAFVARSR
jgi:hypothetical protein